MSDESKPVARVFHTRVFASEPNGGNPCPVVLSADGFSDEQMQSMAGRLGRDTAFVLQPRLAGANLRIRYFVPGHEMGVSGHATIAAIAVALEQRRIAGSRLTVEATNGPFVVGCEPREDGLRITLEQLPPAFGSVVEADRVARVLNVSSSKIENDVSPVQCVSVSRSKLLVPLVGRGVLDRLAPDFPALWRLCEDLGVSGLYPFTRHVEFMTAAARQFPLRAGFSEDPATGVAAAALGAYIVHYDDTLEAGVHHLRIGQGHAMGAPSMLDVIVDNSGDSISRTAISGVAEIVTEELLQL